MSRKYDINFVKKYFEDNGCILLESEYKNPRTHMKYICKCGNRSSIVFDKFKQGKRCKKCAGCEKLTQEYVYNFIKENGCELLSIYKNLYSELNIICYCGRTYITNFYNFRRGSRCKKCRYTKIAEKQKLTYDYVKIFFEDRNCKLLEDKFINVKTKMRYRCICGRESVIDFNKFQQGRRCRICSYSRGSQKQIGPLNKNWIHDRSKIQKIKEIHWLSNPYKKRYRKQYKVPKKGFEVHHIIPIHMFVKHGYYNLDIINNFSNLLALTVEQHYKIGHECTEEEYIQYLNEYGQINNEQKELK